MTSSSFLLVMYKTISEHNSDKCLARCSALPSIEVGLYGCSSLWHFRTGNQPEIFLCDIGSASICQKMQTR